MVLRIRPAKAYQRRDSPIRLLAQHGKAAIKRDLKSALSHLQGLVPTDAAEHLIRTGAFAQVKDTIAWGHWREVLKAPFDRIGKLREAAAALGTRKINGSFHARQQAIRFKKMGLHPGRLEAQDDSLGGTHLASLFDSAALRKDIGNRFNFDRFAQPTQDRIRAAQDDLIQQLTSAARDSVDSIVMAGVQTGLSPADIVGDIRELIGLTDSQAQAVLNYRAMLEGLDSGALQRQLRNTVLDAEIQQAIDDGVPLDDALIDKATDDYRENYLDYRAATIAQTESVRASNAGLQDAYSQAIDRGALPSDAVRQFWQVALDENTCPICLSIPDFNPDGVPIGEPFDSDDGDQDAPPDPHPNCRCSIEIVTDLDKVPDDTGP